MESDHTNRVVATQAGTEKAGGRVNRARNRIEVRERGRGLRYSRSGSREAWIHVIERVVELSIDAKPHPLCDIEILADEHIRPNQSRRENVVACSAAVLAGLCVIVGGHRTAAGECLSGGARSGARIHKALEGTRIQPLDLRNSR